MPIISVSKRLRVTQEISASLTDGSVAANCCNNATTALGVVGLQPSLAVQKCPTPAQKTGG